MRICGTRTSINSDDNLLLSLLLLLFKRYIIRNNKYKRLIRNTVAAGSTAAGKAGIHEYLEINQTLSDVQQSNLRARLRTIYLYPFHISMLYYNIIHTYYYTHHLGFSFSSCV